MTPLQHQCLEAIKRLTVDGVSPSYDMLVDDLQLKSKAQAHRLVHALRDHGLIDLMPGRARSIRVVNDEMQGLALDKLAKAAFRVHRDFHKPTMKDFRAALYHAVTR